MAEILKLEPQGEAMEEYKQAQYYLGRQVDTLTERLLKENQKTTINFQIKLLSEHIEVHFTQDLGEFKDHLIQAYEKHAEVKVVPE
jgi:hypothetical protein